MCSAPLKSSHLGYVLGAVLGRAPIAQGLLRPLVVVPLDPVPNDPPRLLKGLEGVLSDTLLFQTPKEPFDHSILLRHIGREVVSISRGARYAFRNKAGGSIPA